MWFPDGYDERTTLANDQRLADGGRGEEGNVSSVGKGEGRGSVDQGGRERGASTAEMDLVYQVPGRAIRLEQIAHLPRLRQQTILDYSRYDLRDVDSRRLFRVWCLRLRVEV
jgi:hypothetical protein